MSMYFAGGTRNQAIALKHGCYPIDVRRLTEHLCQELDELLMPDGRTNDTAIQWAQRDAAALRDILALPPRSSHELLSFDHVVQVTQAARQPAA